jgi:hypothetical protein
MKRRTIIIAAILVALVAGAVAVDSIPTKAERELHALRDSLRRQGYKFASPVTSISRVGGHLTNDAWKREFI